jgi:uncharacterized protein (TIGR02680 family)
VAGTTRWRPLRTGLVDIFHYDYQEFWFHDGRLLLRGNNGTGKSKVLALTLPFLLDGDLSPSRVEPDGDRAKKMEWNLLLGGKYEERLGYTWLEFGRVAEDGEQLYLTVGCGLRAVQGRGIADRWFFVTSQRLGQDLFLIGSRGTALTRDRLAEAVGPSGQVTQRAEQYRRMLDEHLFRLGTERYDALISLLIQLRQPQLSKRPDEGRLSQALTEALAPLDQAVVSDIAAAFHDLEQQRDELAGLRETYRHVRRFHDRYQRYAAVAARREAGQLRRAHADYEQLQRDLAAVRQQIAEAAREEHDSQTALEAASSELAEQNAAREELAGDPRLKNLDDAQRYADEAAQALAGAEADVARQRKVTVGRQAQHAGAVTAAEATRGGVTATLETLRSCAGRAGLDTEPALLGLAFPDGPWADEDIDAARRAVTEAADHRAEAIAHVTRLAEAAVTAEQEIRQARKRLSERESEADAAAEALAVAGQQRETTAAAHQSAWRGLAAWADRLALPGFSLPDPDEIGLADWAETLDGPHPAERSLREAATAAQRNLAEAAARADATLALARAELGELEAERDRLESGETARPPVAYTRDPVARDGRSGAALWQVTDFAPGLAETERAGLEAALEASGLLDARITPGGELLEAGTHDVIAVAGAAAAHSLAEVLVPVIDAADPQAGTLTVDLVQRVLASVSHAETSEGPYASCAGRWRLGPLYGQWAKDRACYIGHAAREEARRRRLAELVGLTTAAARRLAEAEAAVAAVAARQAALEEVLSDVPTDTALREAHAAVAAAAGVAEQARRRAEDTATDLEWAERDLAQARGARDDAAADTSCPTELSALREMAQQIAGYRQAAAELGAALRLHAARLAELATWEAELARAQEEMSRLQDAARQATLRAAQERQRLQTLRGSIGVSVEELKDRLVTVRARIAELTGRIKSLDGVCRKAAERRAQAQGREQLLAGNLAQAQQHREQAIADLRRFAGTGLLAGAGATEIPDTSMPWAADPAIRLARRLEQQFAAVEAGDEAWRRIQDEITGRYRELAEALTRYGHQALAGLDDWFVVTIAFQGTARNPGELAELLEEEIGYRERMLTERQRQVIENHLINDVASHLQQLISEAEAQVGQMNAELRERPTSTGMRLRLRWETRLDGPAGLPQARARLLRQDADLWSPADREAVGDFLGRQIEAARAEDELATWAELLSRALDYRSWHRFVIERHQDGRWRPAAGPASGGERVLTVSVPLFAAASAHYRSAHQHAPRLIMLDEAFAGVDDQARGQYLGLLATFDLDVAMTSEREWGFYPTVPGIATHQLVRRDGIDAVHVTSWEWDGQRAERAERAVSGRAPAPGGPPGAGAPGSDLW